MGIRLRRGQTVAQSPTLTGTLCSSGRMVRLWLPLLAPRRLALLGSLSRMQMETLSRYVFHGSAIFACLCVV